MQPFSSIHSTRGLSSDNICLMSSHTARNVWSLKLSLFYAVKHYSTHIKIYAIVSYLEFTKNPSFSFVFDFVSISPQRKIKKSISKSYLRHESCLCNTYRHNDMFWFFLTKTDASSTPKSYPYIFKQQLENCNNEGWSEVDIR